MVEVYSLIACFGQFDVVFSRHSFVPPFTSRLYAITANITYIYARYSEQDYVMGTIREDRKDIGRYNGDRVMD